VIDLFDATPSRANCLTAVALIPVRLILEEDKRMQLCLQTELEEKSQSLHSQQLPQ